MAITRAVSAIPHWVALVPLVLVGDIIVASLAWWLVAAI